MPLSLVPGGGAAAAPSPAAAAAAAGGTGTGAGPSPDRRSLKGGLTLAFEPDDDMDGGPAGLGQGQDGEGPPRLFRETCMEERRAGLARYRAMLPGAGAGGPPQGMAAVPPAPPLPHGT